MNLRDGKRKDRGGVQSARAVSRKAQGGPFAERLKTAIGRRRKSEVAAAAQISPQLLDAWLAGSAPSADRLARMALALGVRLLWLTTGEGPMLADTAYQACFGRDELVYVPLFDAAVAAGTPFLDWRPEGDPVARVELPLEAVRTQIRCAPQALVAVVVTGRSMEPMYRDGDVAIIDRSRTEVPAAGGVFLLRTAEGLRIKQVRRDGKHLVLASINNAEFPPERLDVSTALHIQILGRVAATQPDPRRTRIDPVPEPE